MADDLLGAGRLGKLIGASLWSPTAAAVGAGAMFLTGAIGSGTAGLICAAGWLPYWIATAMLLFRFGVTESPQIRHAFRMLLLGCVFSYGVIWGSTLT